MAGCRGWVPPLWVDQEEGVARSDSCSPPVRTLQQARTLADLEGGGQVTTPPLPPSSPTSLLEELLGINYEARCHRSETRSSMC